MADFRGNGPGPVLVNRQEETALWHGCRPVQGLNPVDAVREVRLRQSQDRSEFADRCPFKMTPWSAFNNEFWLVLEQRQPRGNTCRNKVMKQ